MKHLYLVIIGTFIVGFLSGVYAFFMTREETNTLPREDETMATLQIVADEYGGCEHLGCASYRLLEDGSYIYIAPGRGGEERFKDSLSSKQTKELLDLIETAPLSRIENSTFTGSCPAYVDGIAYRFTIMVEGVRRSFDSCEQDVASSQLFNTLSNYFDVFRIVHTTE